MNDNKHKLVPIACPYRDGKVCNLPHPFAVCAYYQEGGYKQDKNGAVHFEKSTCGACREDDE